ncbi:hypothetical protein [Falsiroseomonas sp.]|uniref:hypothetical protein n=1 Tax=Falsiroseomonas sp. TaxID=2870721 RepID=UPI003F6FD58C
MNVTDLFVLLQPLNKEPVLDCTGDHLTCAPCTLKSVLMQARDEVTLALIVAVDRAAGQVTPSSADFALFCARMLENLVALHPHGVALARAALLLAEAKAPLRAADRRHLDG